MKRIRQLIFIFLLYACYVPSGFCFETLFYVLRNDSSERMAAAEASMLSLNDHYQAINILVPQAYNLDDKGIVWGSVNSEVKEFATKHAMKIMPLITNVEFDKEIGHQFLANPNAQSQAIQTIIDICTKEKYYGVQFDLEMIALEDKEALTKFYQMAAESLHKKGFKVSFAVAPIVAPPPMSSEFLKKIYNNWEGAYDFKKLGEAADFVSIMAYNQHGGVTTPGPTASIAWVEAAIKYALQYIPADKISLGIPDYSTYWFTGTDNSRSSGKTAVQSLGIPYKKAMKLLELNKVNLQWDENTKLQFAIYERNWLNEYLYVENEKTFAAKLALAKKYNLHGISVFDLGTEDPKIWNTLTQT